jgi:hypothetical protein
MNEERAREILGDRIQSDGSLFDALCYLNTRGSFATLDGEFTAEELEAIAWWMTNKLDR